MQLYTEEQVMKAYNTGIQDEYNGMYKEDIAALKLTPIELPNGLNTFKKIIEDRPTEFSQYNAYTLLFVIDLIQNGKKVPEQIELIKMINQNK
jgi:hypothetical protein